MSNSQVVRCHASRQQSCHDACAGIDYRLQYWQHSKNKTTRQHENINSNHVDFVMIAINIFSRAACGHAFVSMAAELWYIYHVRISFNDYCLRFVGSHDDVMAAVACFYSFKSLKQNPYVKNS